jgi:hypothetical protein
MLFTGLLVEDPVYVSRITLSCNADLTAGWLAVIRHHRHLCHQPDLFPYVLAVR